MIKYKLYAEFIQKEENGNYYIDPQIERFFKVDLSKNKNIQERSIVKFKDADLSHVSISQKVIDSIIPYSIDKEEFIIRQISFENCQLGNQGVEILSEFLNSSKNQLYYLNLKNNKFDF